MYRQRKHQEGMALLLAFLAIMVIISAVALVMGHVNSAKKSTDAVVTGAILDEACKAGIDIGIEKLWYQYVVNNGNTTGNLASYRYYTDTVYEVPNNEDVNGNGVQDAGEHDLNGDGSFTIAAPLVVYDPATDSDDVELESGARVAGLTISRTDDTSGSVFTLRVAAKLGERTRTAVQTVRISGTPFSGYEYGVLAKNINCILCHAGFRPLDQEYNTDASLYGTFDRVKVATLERLLFRTGSADSKLAGTVYTRGDVCNEYGSSISASTLASSSFKGYDFDRTNGRVLQDGTTGNMSVVGLVNAAVDEEGRPEQFASLYKSYPSDPDLMTDGELPQTFPAPFPDDDEDRYVDDAEFDKVANSLQGSISGGIAYGVPEGSVYAGTALPAASNDALATLSSTGKYDGNLILVGTDASPIVLDGDVAVNGDLVIKGKVKGKGQFFVRGNSYIVGNVTYADASGEFGVAADGTENAMALVTGGSVLMGDYLTIRGKNHTADTSKYPDSSRSVKVRTANYSANVTKSGVTQTLRYGYFDPGVVDAGEIQTTMLDASGNPVTRTGQQYSFTQSELMLFNNLEIEKAAADPTYRPRFYGLRDSQPNNLYTYHYGTDEHAVRYDESGGGVKKLTDYMTQQGIPLSILDNSSFHYMNPSGNWISEDSLRHIWWDDEQSRVRGDSFKFDGLLYSNNAIFAITRSYVRHGSNTEGKMRVRGAIICPDLGVLTPGPDVAGTESFTLLYDRRVKEFWAPEDTTQVAFNRMVYMPGQSE